MTLYEIWEKSDPVRPPRSRLYALTPVGVGTSEVESLTSYLRRLAAAHGVTVSKLIQNEILPLCQPKRGSSTFLGQKSRVVHGPGCSALEVTWALQRLTGQMQLTYLTFLPWADVIALDDMLRLERAWCPLCLEEQRQAEQPVVEPLLWTLQPIQLCVKHQFPLQSLCPHCQQPLPWLAAYSRPGFCSNCYTWLGLAPHPLPNPLADLTEAELFWQNWLAQALGYLLAATPTLPYTPRLEWFAFSLAHICAQIAQGQVDLLTQHLQACHLHLSADQIKDWLAEKTRPSFTAFFELAYCLQIEPFHLLNYHSLPHDPRPLRPLNFKRSYSKADLFIANPHQLAQTLETVLANDHNAPPSLTQLSQQLGFSNAHHLKTYFPEQTKLIKQRYQTYTQTMQTQRLASLRQDVRQAVFDLHAQGLDPTISRLNHYLGKPKINMNPHVRAAWKQARQELGLD